MFHEYHINNAHINYNLDLEAIIQNRQINNNNNNNNNDDNNNNIIIIIIIIILSSNTINFV